MKHRTNCAFFGFTGFALLAPITAYSATLQERDNSAAQVEDIVVTAQRQAQPLQTVPIAVTAITGAQLKATGLASSASLEAAVPSLTMSRTTATATPFLRGVGSTIPGVNNEPSVATYVDGVYIAAPATNIFSFNNIERIEVLKGPQGTLFGRNATGGVIQLITPDPRHELAGNFQIGLGNYQTIATSAYVTTGLGENLAGDLAVLYNNQNEGFGRNIATGQEIHLGKEFSARSKLLFTPSDHTEIRLAGDYLYLNNTADSSRQAMGAVSVTGTPSPGRFNSNSNVAEAAKGYHWGLSLHLDQDLGFARFKSISAYRNLKRDILFDGDRSPSRILDALLLQRAREITQELQLFSSETSSLDWVLGAYYFNYKAGSEPLHLEGTALGALPFRDINSVQRTKSGSVYAQGTYEIVENLKATAGIRYTWEKATLHSFFRNGNAPIVTNTPLKTTFNKPTWRLALDYQAWENVLAYVSYNRGLKSGGFNLTTPTDPAYMPEKLDAYEVGLKSELFDRRLRLNVAAYFYNFSDIQVIVATGPASNALINAASARIRGVDVDFQAKPFANLTISGGFGYIYKAEYKSFRNAISFRESGGFPAIPIDATGNRTVNSPKFSGSTTVSYRIPSAIGDFTINGTVIRNSGFYSGADNRPKLPAYTLLNASINWSSSDERLGFQIWGKNLTDAHYLSNLVPSATFGDQVRDGDPRTYGASMSYKF